MQNRKLPSIAAIAIALAIFAAGPDPARAETSQQCAVNFAVCFGQCSNMHPVEDASGLGLCQSNCGSTRAKCDATASDRNAGMQAEPGPKRPRRVGPQPSILSNETPLMGASPAPMGSPGSVKGTGGVQIR
jgi:hypothetical protein